MGVALLLHHYKCLCPVSWLNESLWNIRTQLDTNITEHELLHVCTTPMATTYQHLCSLWVLQFLHNLPVRAWRNSTCTRRWCTPRNPRPGSKWKNRNIHVFYLLRLRVECGELFNEQGRRIFTSQRRGLQVKWLAIFNRCNKLCTYTWYPHTATHSCRDVLLQYSSTCFIDTHMFQTVYSVSYVDIIMSYLMGRDPEDKDTEYRINVYGMISTHE